MVNTKEIVPLAVIETVVGTVTVPAKRIPVSSTDRALGLDETKAIPVKS
jgi:hypothetical protein